MAKIFILENNEGTAYALKEAFRNSGTHDVVVCSDPKKALSTIVIWQPNIIISEYLEVDGGWLCKEVKKMRMTKHTPIIFTCHIGKHTDVCKLRDRLLNQYMATDFIAKPFSVEKMMNITNKHLCSCLSS